jgi:hypothetical protein
MGERRVTDAGRRLRQHLKRVGLSIPEWCEKHGFDDSMRITIQRICTGERWASIPADTIVRIVDAVEDDGHSFDFRWFGSDTARAG